MIGRWTSACPLSIRHIKPSSTDFSVWGVLATLILSCTSTITSAQSEADSKSFNKDMPITTSSSHFQLEDLKGDEIDFILTRRYNQEQIFFENLLVENDDGNSRTYSISELEEYCVGGDRIKCFYTGMVGVLDVKHQEHRGNIEGPFRPKGHNYALLALTSACEHGHVQSCFEVGKAHANGFGVEQDLTIAAVIYQQICAEDAPVACLELAAAYDTGEGVEQDAVKAASLYEQACNSGVSRACNDFGTAYARGRGVNRDLVKAASLFEQACKDGKTLACNNLGIAYEEGQGVKPDLVKAAGIFETACIDGHLPACVRLCSIFDRTEDIDGAFASSRSALEFACRTHKGNGDIINSVLRPAPLPLQVTQP